MNQIIPAISLITWSYWADDTNFLLTANWGEFEPSLSRLEYKRIVRSFCSRFVVSFPPALQGIFWVLILCSVPAKRACFHCKWVLLLLRHPHLELYSRESLQLSSRCFLPGVSSPWRKNGSWESFWFSELLQVEVWHRFFCLQLLIGKCIQLALGIVTGCDVLKSPHFTDFQVFKVSKSLPRSIVS